MILSEKELRAMTGYKQHQKQREELEHLEIPYKVRRDGSLLVILADTVKSSAPEPEMHL